MAMAAKRAAAAPQKETTPQQERAVERLLLLRLAEKLGQSRAELLYGPHPLTDREFAEWKALWVFEHQLAEHRAEEEKRGGS